MARFLAGRLAQAVFSLFAVTLILFVVTRLTGDPVAVLLPREATAEMREQITREVGLDKPYVVQYVNYLGRLVQGDLGDSMRTQRPVTDMLVSRLPATLELGAAALVITLVIGIPLGMYAGYKRGTWIDKAASSLAVMGQAAPAFWVALLLIILLSVRLQLLPSGGRDGLQNLIMPAFVMAWAGIAGVTRLMRSSVLETLETDYIRFVRIKGVSESKVLWKHAMRNAALPVLTFGGVIAAGMVTGSVVTEAVFVWPGMGRLLIDAIESRDFPVVQGVVLMLAAVYLMANVVIDVLYVYLNPRLRVSEAE